MKKTSRIYITIALTLIALLETVFIGCGSSGGSSSREDLEETKAIFVTEYPTKVTNGTFTLSSKHSNISITATEKDTLKDNNASIILYEREPSTKESDIFGNNSSRIYKLVVTRPSDKLSFLSSSAEEIKKLDKPITIKLSQKFLINANEEPQFFLGTRNNSQADWQYSKLEKDYFQNKNTYNSNSLRMSGSEGASTFNFNITTYNLGEEMTIFNGSRKSPGILKAPSRGLNSVKSMIFSTSLPYLDLKFNDSGEMVYNTDLVVNSCIEANLSNSLFNGSKVKTILTFFTYSPTTIESLQAVGLSTAFAEQTVSDVPNGGGGDKYTHTVTFSDYPNPVISGNLATYSFTLKIRNLKLSQFPDNFNIKTILTDSTPITYSTEYNLPRERILSYLAPISPTLSLGEASVGSSLVAKYIAHDIASIAVKYSYPGIVEKLDMPGNLSKDPVNHTITFSPTQPWPSHKEITAILYASCCNSHGSNGTKNAEFSFETGGLGSGSIVIGDGTVYDQVTVSLQEPNPVDNVPITTPIVLKFSENISWVSGYNSLLRFASGTHPLTIQSTNYDSSAQTLTIQPTEPLRYKTNYNLILNKLTDNVSHKYVSTTAFAFSTGDGTHSNATVVASDSCIIDGKLMAKPIFIVDFGKDICKSDYIDERKITQAFESLKIYRDDRVIPMSQIDKNWILPYQKMQMVLNAPLEANTSYRVVMGNNVLDYENLTITPFTPFVFTTLDDISLSLVTPAVLTNVPIDTNIGIKFSDPITWISSYSKSINLFIGKQEIPMENYLYDDVSRTVTMKPVDQLRYNENYTILIAPDLYNAPTMQHIASNAFYFKTGDGSHVNATAKLADNSIHNGKAIITSTIEVDFGGSVLSYNAAKSAIKLKKNDNIISFTPYLSWSDNYKKLAITYTLEPNTAYTLTMDEGLKTNKGELIEAFAPFTFTTVEDITAQITVPTSSANVDPSTDIVIEFSDDIAWSGSDSDKRLFYFYRGTTNMNSSLTNFEYATAPKTLTLTPSNMLYNASYTLQLDQGLVNAITGQKVATFSFYFETKDGTYNKAEAKLSDSSIVGAKAILKPRINIDFHKKVMDLGAAQDKIKLYKDGALVSGFKREWANDRSKVDLVFTTALKPEAEYILKMEGSTKDFEGISIDAFDDLTFITMPNITAELTTPADRNNADINTKLVVTFSNNISWSNERDMDKIKLWHNGQQIAMKSYLYSDPEKKLTMTLKSQLLHDSEYTLRIMKDILNESTGQEVATATILLKTVDGIHDKASIAFDDGSVIDGLSILQPSLTVDLKSNVLSSDLNKIKNGIKVFKGGNKIEGVYKTWANEYSKLRLTFSTPLEAMSNYKVTMDEGARNFKGILIDSFDDFYFNTQDTIGISLTSPPTTTNVATSTKIVVTFSSPIDWTDGEKNKFTFKIGDTVLSIASFSYDAGSRDLTIRPVEPLLYDTTYTLDIKKGIKNNTTHQITAAATFEFTTSGGNHSNAQLIISEADKVNELLTTEDIYNGIKDALVVTPTFVVDFGKEVLNARTAANSVKLYIASTNQEVTSLEKTWLSTDKQLQIKLASNSMLVSDNKFKLLMYSGVKDREGSDIEPFATYIFKTTPNGTGSKNSPYLIYTSSQLDGIRNNLKFFYKLKKDIDLATATYSSANNPKDYGWKPIGTTTKGFEGGLDGDGHIIRGLSINRPNEDSVGFFGRIASGTVKNLTFEEGIVIGKNSTGCVAGYAYNSTIAKCYNKSVKVKATGYAGGICGDIYSTSLSYSKNSAEIVSAGEKAGGIVGWNNMYSKINSCCNDGKVTSTSNYAGGIAGYNNARVINCLNTGLIFAYEYVGGIIGYNARPAIVSRCISLGGIVSTNLAATNIGGIGGFCERNAQISDCIIVDETYINGSSCTENSQIVFNYSDGSHLNNNYCFGDLTEMNREVAKSSNWSDGAWNSLYWRFNDGTAPELVGVGD